MNAVFTVFYLVFFAATFLLRRTIRRKTLSAERLPGKVVASWTSACIFYLYLALLFGSLVEYFAAGRPINPALSAAGVILYAVSIAGRQWAFASLGKYWSVNIEIRENQEVLRAGPYRHIRHPNSFFHALEVAALTAVPNAFYCFAVFAAVYLPVLVYRSVIEEGAMSAQIPEAYGKYRREVPAFIPRFRRTG